MKTYILRSSHGDITVDENGYPLSVERSSQDEPWCYVDVQQFDLTPPHAQKMLAKYGEVDILDCGMHMAYGTYEGPVDHRGLDEAEAWAKDMWRMGS